MTNVLYEEIWGCVTSANHSYTKGPASWRKVPIKGRPRYTLRDVWATYVVTLTFSFDESQMASWRSFWASIGHGSQGFWVSFPMDSLTVFSLGESYYVEPTGPFVATLSDFMLWTVTLQVELPAGAVTPRTLCDVLYGGPITDPGGDSIYGGPIDALAPDVIEPCAQVFA